MKRKRDPLGGREVMAMIKEPNYEPTLPKGRAGKCLLSTAIMQIKWLLFGVPKPRRKGRWVYNSLDKIWRYYLDDIKVE